MWVMIMISAFILGAVSSCSSAPDSVPLPPPESVPVVDENLARFYEQELDWRECGGAYCTYVEVPLDYSDPNGSTVELAVVRVPASGDAIGALLVNPGGPGGSAFDYAKAADYIVSNDVRRTFDIVGVDPRGVGKSDPIECLDDALLDELFAADGTPDDPGEEARFVEDASIVAEQCEANASALWTNMDTYAAAKDMDIVRAVLDEPVLNYLGKSYGTALGAAYAELFPTLVGRMVLDGVLPMDLSSEEASLGQAVGFEVALAHFAEDCAGRRSCPFEGDGDEVVNEIRQFLLDLDTNPLPSDDGRLLTESLGSYAVASFLYFPAYDYDRLRGALEVAVKEGRGDALLSLVDERASRGPDGKYADNSTEAFYAVTCADAPYGGSLDDVRALADDWEEVAPTFGRGMAWGLLLCADWPAGPTETRGVIDAAGAPPILVVSTSAGRFSGSPGERPGQRRSTRDGSAPASRSELHTSLGSRSAAGF